MIDDEDISTTHKFAPSAATSPPGESAATTNIDLIWHGDHTKEPLVDWLVEDMLYKIGLAMISGQWGTYKTFIAIDLSASIMTKRPLSLGAPFTGKVGCCS